MNYSITQFGVPLDKSLYTIDEEAKTFSSNERGLVLDFNLENGWKFKTGSNCTFATGSYCTFDTLFNCTFNTGSDCTFNTRYNCIFNTGSNCVVVRRDVYEVIELRKGIKIELKGYGIKGYTLIDEAKKMVYQNSKIKE